MFDIVDPATEVFTVTDEDADQDEASDYLLGVAWVDCGQITMPDSGSGFVGDPNELLDPGFVDDSFDPSMLPGMVPDNLSFTTDPNTGGASAIGWLAGIDADNDDFSDNFNAAMSWFQFLAPPTPGPCTLTVVVTDLGNNGMPLPGEIPNPGIDWGSVAFDVVDPDAPRPRPPCRRSPEEPGDDTTDDDDHRAGAAAGRRLDHDVDDHHDGSLSGRRELRDHDHDVDDADDHHHDGSVSGRRELRDDDHDVDDGSGGRPGRPDDHHDAARTTTRATRRPQHPDHAR